VFAHTVTWAVYKDDPCEEISKGMGLSWDVRNGLQELLALLQPLNGRAVLRETAVKRGRASCRSCGLRACVALTRQHVRIHEVCEDSSAGMDREEGLCDGLKEYVALPT